MNISINVNQYDETKLSFGRRNPDNAKSVRSTLAKKRAGKADKWYNSETG